MGMRFCMLGSGSGGNCSLLETGRTRLLIDCARLGQRYIKERLEELGARLDEVDGILATHMHGDHVDGGVTYPLCRKYDIPLYVHEGSVKDLMRRSDKFLDLERAGLVRRFSSEPFMLRELMIRPFEVTHGAGGWNRDIVGRPVGYRISLIEGAKETAVAYATDLGGVNDGIVEAMAGADIIALESNHDVEAEKKSTRPKFLVDWVLGPRGHLSNEQAATALGKMVARGGGKTRHITLAHLSEDCNTPELALAAVSGALQLAGATDISLCVASQKDLSPEIIV